MSAEEELYDIYEVARRLAEELTHFQGEINHYLDMNNSLDNKANYGIQLNNKLVELKYIFLNGGLEFNEQSVLYDPIMFGLINLTERFTSWLEKEREKIEKLSKRNKIKQMPEFAMKYRTFADTIFNYNLEKYIVVCIVEQAHSLQEDFVLDKRFEKIESYEQEMGALGLADLISELRQSLIDNGFELEKPFVYQL